MGDLDAKAEEDLTPDERLAWLRARGVIVEQPTDRKKYSPPADGRTFSFVRVPVDEGLNCEERSGPQAGGDALPALLGPEFAGGDVPDSALEAHAAASGQAISLPALRAVLARGGAESFRLAVPTEANGGEGVYAYLDEASALKGLPRNERATLLAHRCGFPETCVLCGDIYIGRQKWRKGGLVKNIDFTLSDLDHNSLWVQRAPTENLEFQKAMQPEAHAAAQEAVSNNSGLTEEVDEGDYKYTQDEDDIEITFPIGTDVTKRDVKIEFLRRELRVTKPISFSIKLWKLVDVDGCSWTMGDGKVKISLQKQGGGHWPQLAQEKHH